MKLYASKCHEKSYRPLSENVSNHKVIFYTYPLFFTILLYIFFICKQTLIWFQFSSVKENNHISRLNYLWKSTIFFNSSYEEQCLSHVKEGKGEEVEHGGTKVKG